MRVLRVGEGGGVVRDEMGRVGGEAREELVRDLGGGDEVVRLVVFQGDNKWAKGVMEAIRLLVDKEPAGRKSWLAVRHVNLGLLPTSQMSWDDAVDMLDEQRGGWVHVHENVDVREMEQKKDAVVQHFRAYLGGRMTAHCSHVEQVKTYAPGVMHCVFDMHIAPLPASRIAIENG